MGLKIGDRVRIKDIPRSKWSIYPECTHIMSAFFNTKTTIIDISYADFSGDCDMYLLYNNGFAWREDWLERVADNIILPADINRS